MRKPLPPTYFYSAIILELVLHFVFPVYTIRNLIVDIFGILLIVVGCIFNYSTHKFLKKFNTTVKPFEYSTHLVTFEIFRISRNPMYLGMSSILTGEAIILGSLSTLIVVGCFIVIMQKVFIEVEEKMLFEKFGNVYIDYKRKTPRWI